MIFRLIKIKFTGVLRSMLIGRKPKAGVFPIVIAAFLFIYMVFAGYMMFYGYYSILALPIIDAGVRWYYYFFALSAAFLLSLVITSLLGAGTVYSSKDNDLLFSLPIKPGQILLSRVAYVMGISFIYTGAVTAAGIVAVSEAGPVGIAEISLYILASLYMYLFASAIALIIAKIIAHLVRRFSNQTLLALLVSLVFVGAYLYMSFTSYGFILEIAEHAGEAADTASKLFFPLFLGNIPAAGNVPDLVILAVIAVIAFASVYRRLGKTMISSAMELQKGPKKKKAGNRIVSKANSPFTALVIKELKHAAGSANYILNSAFGAVLLIGASAAAVIEAPTVMSFIASNGMEDMLPIYGALTIMAGLSGIYMTAASISIEGKNIWVTFMLPLPLSESLKAKLAAHLIVSVPAALIAVCCLSFAFRFSLLIWLCLAVSSAVFAVYTGLIGLLFNLKHPRLDYMNEVYAVKQGLPTLFAMGTGALTIGLFYYGYNRLAVILPAGIYIAVFTAFLVLADWLIWEWITDTGVKIFGRLG